MTERANGDLEPIAFDSITHGAFSNPLLKEIYRRFGKKAFARSSACGEFESFLRRLGASSKGKVCLEIGTFHGITAVVLSQFFERVICVSVDEMEVMRHEIVAHLGIKNIRFFDVADNEEKADIVKRFDFDFAYLDGNHTYDTREDFALVKHCGHVLWHEAWPLQAPVWNTLKSLPTQEVLWATCDPLAYWERGASFVWARD